MGYIGETKAKEIALAKAGVSESDLTFYTVGLDTHKGVMVYDVEFISGSYEFDCEVNAMTGEIVKFEKNTMALLFQMYRLKSTGSSRSTVRRKKTRLSAIFHWKRPRRLHWIMQG